MQHKSGRFIEYFELVQVNATLKFESLFPSIYSACTLGMHSISLNQLRDNTNKKYNNCNNIIRETITS